MSIIVRSRSRNTAGSDVSDCPFDSATRLGDRLVSTSLATAIVVCSARYGSKVNIAPGRQLGSTNRAGDPRKRCENAPLCKVECRDFLAPLQWRPAIAKTAIQSSITIVGL